MLTSARCASLAEAAIPGNSTIRLGMGSGAVTAALIIITLDVLMVESPATMACLEFGKLIQLLAVVPLEAPRDALFDSSVGIFGTEELNQH